MVKRIHNHLTEVHKIKRESKYYRKCLREAVPHEVDVLSSSESSESCEMTDDSASSSSQSYQPPPCKVKKTNNEKGHVNMYHTVYGSSGEGDEELSRDVDCESKIDRESEDEDDVNDTFKLDPNVRKIFDKFECWLKGPDGGSKGDRSAVQCRRQIEIVVNYIESKKPNLDNILHKTILRDQWLSKFEKEKQPGTVKSYLGSLNQFYRFLKCENMDVGISIEQLSSLSDQVILWGRSYRKKSAGRFWEKRMEDLASLRTPEQIKEFETSKIAREAVRLLGQYDNEERADSPNQSEFTTVRDYLLTIICINNGARSGALANMTLQEFERATKEDGCAVVRVHNHKTLFSHGPVNVVLDQSLHRYTAIFIEKFRNRIEGTTTDGNAPVFVTWNQGGMTSSHVGAQIGSCWGKVFGREISSGGATAFRKAAVSAVHQGNEELRGDLAELMTHKKATADRYYLLKNKGQSAVKTSKQLSKIMRTATATSTAKEEHSDEHDDGFSCGRYSWNDDEVCELKSAFSNHIHMKKISLAEVREIIKDTLLLQNIPPEKVRNKVRSCFGKDNWKAKRKARSCRLYQQRLNHRTNA